MLFRSQHEGTPAGPTRDEPGIAAADWPCRRAFMLPHQAKRLLEESGKATPEAIALIDQQIIEMNENYHTSIEDLFRPIRNSMLAGDLTFLAEKKYAFYYGLSVQYARTNHIKGSRLLMKKEDFKRYTRIANTTERFCWEVCS